MASANNLLKFILGDKDSVIDQWGIVAQYVAGDARSMMALKAYATGLDLNGTLVHQT